MTQYRVKALDAGIACDVRASRRSPEYDHPAVSEVASGTGPCRACLGLFRVGAEERLLFTYRPWSGSDAVGAPGPIFIHTEACEPFQGDGIPAGLLTLPLLAEARADDGRILGTAAASGEACDPVLRAYFADPAVDFVFLRNGEAGCHIARVDRA